ncbi:contractile injection system tape measure protein [Ekhidna sp.]|uniref:contractile injection system tape measure protein n=1 Tax=Ekhidna sp. TaxID=2608089 RepID=UPI00329A3F72
MKSSTHHIKSKVFEISFNDENESLRFQKSFSDFIRNELVEITEKCLSEFNGPTLKVINRLELDLGDIAYEGYEKTLTSRYEEALTRALFNKLEFEGPDKEEEEDSPASIIFMIRHFLLKGYMPWNYDESSWDSFNQMFEHASLINMDLLIEELNNLLTSDQSRTRLIHQLEESTIQNLVKFIEPSQSTLILEYHKSWIEGEKKRTLFGETNNRLSKSFWIFIFNYLYEERGSYFNTRSFLISTLRQIANQFNLSYLEVIGQLRIVHEEIGNTRNNDLYYLLEEILSMDVETFEKEDETAQDSSEIVEINVSDLSYFIQKGKWPSHVKVHILFPRAFANLASSKPQELIKLIQQAAKDISRLNKIINLLGNNHINDLYSLLEPYSQVELMAYDEFFRDLKRDTFISTKSGESITALIIQTLTKRNTTFFNHQEFLRNFFEIIAYQSKTKYKTLLQNTYEELESTKYEFVDSRTGKFMKAFLIAETNTKSKKRKRLHVSELDIEWIEESIVSGMIHPVLEREGYFSILEVLKFLATEEPPTFNKFIEQRLKKRKFIESFSDLLDTNLFNYLKPVETSEKRKWKRLFQSIDRVSVSQSLHQSDLQRALKTLTLRWMYGYFKLDSDRAEQDLIQIARDHNLDFNLFLRALIRLADYSTDEEFKSQIIPLADRLGIRAQSQERLSIIVDSGAGKPADQYIEKQIALVISAINGIVNSEELELLGFRSADEALRQLMKSHQGLLKEKLGSLQKWHQSFLGIGREIPLSTYYSLLAMLDSIAGKKVTIILRKLEIQLNEGAQSVNRFLNITRSLALYRLSESTFQTSKFIDDFVQLIRDSSPTIYSQVIPVLSKNISTISIPTRGNANDIIRDLEAQLNQVNDTNLLMDEKVLSKLINEEYFGESLEKEATITPYFDETEDVVYDEIYIENAGLVILSSYFSILFERMSLLENGKFLSLEKQEMAVLLLQHLMLDKPPLNEHHLPLNKVLCGLDISHPIRTDIQISHKDQEVINGLIEAVIGYWSAIGHSTIEGFQGSWLWRKGKLEHKTECWELKVEQNSYDMLLDRLPFTLSPIKLSWMDKPLIVEWR